MELLPEYQCLGIGTQLIQSVISQAKSLNKPVVLHVLKINPAKSLYERLGFETVEEIATGFDCNDIKRGVKYKMSTIAGNKYV
ncbi:MAG: GNAT family N-acetyltransferase [Scytonematopsis contorta HA4267-MV1]|nr:GNAT family N-acetyltransferase [Scytonematopsis contorta HA4267-MV1]